MRRYSSLAVESPGLTVWYPPRSANTPSRVSRRKPASRLFASGPWHVKQLSDRSGRMSRLKSTGFGLPAGTAALTGALVSHPRKTDVPRRAIDAPIRKVDLAHLFTIGLPRRFQSQLAGGGSTNPDLP